jgi:hypothetical protein
VGRLRPVRIDPVATYWQRVDTHGPLSTWRPDLGPCWLWTGPVNGAGYGYAWDGTRPIGAHVLAVLLSGRPIPAGHEPDHLCAVRTCQRPDHLEVVTTWENHRRAVARSQALRLAAWHADLAAMGQQAFALPDVRPSRPGPGGRCLRGDP